MNVDCIELNIYDLDPDAETFTLFSLHVREKMSNSDGKCITVFLSRFGAFLESSLQFLSIALAHFSKQS